MYVARKTTREFSRDRCTDLAAALTYYGVLSLFPAAIALLSLVGLVGQGPSTVKTLTGILQDVGAGSVASTLEPTLMSLSQAPRAGFALVIGLAAALWSASGYVTSFGRALNDVYEVQEGRPFWKLRPVMLVVTLVVIVLVALVAVALVLTGPAAQAVGDAIGLGSTAVTVWNIAKWPVLLLVVVAIVAIVALLYYATPNVKQPRFRWISVGALFAIIVWILASVAFGFSSRTSPATTRPTDPSPESSSSSSGSGSPTSRYSSEPSSTPSSNAAVSCKPASPPKRPSSCHHAMTTASAKRTKSTRTTSTAAATSA